MIELIVERWSYPGGEEEFLWSVWQDGRRVEMGGPRDTAAAAEKEGRAYCRQRLARNPDEVTRL